MNRSPFTSPGSMVNFLLDLQSGVRAAQVAAARQDPSASSRTLDKLGELDERIAREILQVSLQSDWKPQRVAIGDVLARG